METLVRQGITIYLHLARKNLKKLEMTSEVNLSRNAWQIRIYKANPK